MTHKLYPLYKKAVAEILEVWSGGTLCEKCPQRIASAGKGRLPRGV
jgi:hypothetical protein